MQFVLVLYCLVLVLLFFRVMCEWQKEQDRLQRLWDESEDIDPFYTAEKDSEEESEIDHLSTHSDYPDQEQEGEGPEEIDGLEKERQEKEIEQEVQVLLGKNGTKWLAKMSSKNVRTRSENIISHLPGVRAYGKAAKTPLECFQLFIDEQMIADVVINTNYRIKEKSEKWKSSAHYGETTVVEIKALLGLLYLSGVFRNNHRNVEELWNTDGTGMDIFRCTMSQRRFQFLISCLGFDNKESRPERLKIDKLAHIRAIVDKFTGNCKAAYTPSEYLTVDEKLESFRGRCGFRQYIPNKPAKYGIKVQALVDARTYYLVNMEVYVGVQPEGPFRVSNSPKDIVDRLVAPVSGTKRNITCDNWYTSVPLFESLLQKHKLTAVGTIRKNKADIPAKLLETRNKEVFSSQFAFQKDLTLLSYVSKKGKVTLLLSSLHHDDTILPDSEKKLPEMISFYNFTKCGVDVVDEMSASYSVARATRRWPLAIFYSLLNTAGINSQIIFRENNNGNKLSRRLFIKELGMQLVKGCHIERKENPRLSRELRSNIRTVLGETTESIPKKPRPNQQGRCTKCPRARDRKTKNVCAVCNTFICLEHSLLFCKDCTKLQEFNVL